MIVTSICPCTHLLRFLMPVIAGASTSRARTKVRSPAPQLFMKGYLRHFLGVLAVPAHEPTVVEHLGPEVFHKAVECAWICNNQLSREFNFSIAVQRSLPLPVLAVLPRSRRV